MLIIVLFRLPSLYLDLGVQYITDRKPCCRNDGPHSLAEIHYTTIILELTVSAEISESTGTSTAGQRYVLLCNMHGLENFSSTISYKSTKNNGTTWVQVGSNSETLSFSPLRLSDAGQHTCHVSVSSDDEFRTHAANASN